MTECQVICRTCRTDDGRNPRRWDWLCEHCAEQHAEDHRREHPDHDIDLRITVEPTMDDLRRQIRTADTFLQKRGW